jgi:uncharacterized membrane protein
MSSLPTYLRRTLVGGMLVALPLVLFVNLVVWLGSWVGNQVMPLAVLLADWAIVPLWVGKSLGIAIVLGVCFVLGAFVGNRLGHRVFTWLEVNTVGRMPGYKVIKEIVGYFGQTDRNPFARPVLVKISDAATFTGFLSDERADSCTVFIPTGPNPTTGLVVHVHPSQVARLGAPGPEVLKTIIACGAGSTAVLQTVRS